MTGAFAGSPFLVHRAAGRLLPVEYTGSLKNKGGNAVLEHLNGNRGRAVSARVLTVVFLLLALLPAGPAAAADDGSFLSPLAY